VRISLLLAGAFSLVVPASAVAGSSWVEQANAICRAGKAARAAREPHFTSPLTYSQGARVAEVALPLEARDLARLRAITAPKPRGAAHALQLVAADVAHLRAVLKAWRRHDLATFKTLFNRWEFDRSPGAAMAAAGAKDCA
jgi:hypothetical protein